MTDTELEELKAGLAGVSEVCRVTADGRVISLIPWRGTTQRELKQALNSDGYPSVRLTINGRRVHLAVHRLVAAFHLPPRPSPIHELRHLDGDKLNRDAANLAWGTRAENAKDRTSHGTCRAADNARKTLRSRSGERCVTAKLTDAEAAAIRARFLAGEKPYQIAPDFPVVSYWAVNNAAKLKTFKAV